MAITVGELQAIVESGDADRTSRLEWILRKVPAIQNRMDHRERIQL
jgi:hypothetical protein